MNAGLWQRWKEEKWLKLHACKCKKVAFGSQSWVITHFLNQFRSAFVRQTTEKHSWNVSGVNTLLTQTIALSLSRKEVVVYHFFISEASLHLYSTVHCIYTNLNLPAKTSAPASLIEERKKKKKKRTAVGWKVWSHLSWLWVAEGKVERRG